MTESSFEIKKCTCNSCNTHFRNGDFVFRPLLAKVNYCNECAQTAPHHKKDRFLQFIVDDNRAELIINKGALRSLPNKIYQLKRSNNMFIISDSADSYQQGLRSGNYALEITNNCAILLLPYTLRCSSIEFLERKEEYTNIFKPFCNAADMRGAILCFDSRNRLIGISNKCLTEMENDYKPKLLAGSDSLIAKTLDLRSIHFAGSEAEQNDKADTSDDEPPKPLFQQEKQDKEVKPLKDRYENRPIDPRDFLNYCKTRIHGQDAELKKAVYLVSKYVENVKSGRSYTADNWVLTAPSGAGKTEFFRTVRDYFKAKGINIPVIQLDLSRFTEEGYKGADPSTIPTRILEKFPYSKGEAICFLDEADKKLLPSISSAGINTNALVQSNMLTLVEGIEMKVEADGKDRHFDTTHTMFVFMGAFQDLRKDRTNPKKTKSVGFVTDCACDDSEENLSIYDNITIDDIISYGMQDELAGRLTQVINFRRMSKPDMIELIKCKAKQIGEEYNIKLKLSDTAAEELAEIAFGPLGVRRPMNIIKELAFNTISEAYFDGGYNADTDTIVIDSQNSAHIRTPMPIRRKQCG